MWSRLQKILNDSKRISSFDFIRSVSIITIVLTHFEVFDIKGVGVDSFFVLSGFLIAMILSKDKDDVNKRYFIGRSTKILPSYFFFLIIGFSIGTLLGSDIFGEEIPKLSEWPQYFFFYRNYAGLPNRWAFEHVWALCVEEQFYVLIFIFSITCGSRSTFQKQLPIFGIVLVLIGVISKTQAIFTDFAEYPTYTHNRLDAFGYGILLFSFQLQKIEWLKNKWLLILALLALSTVVLMDTSEHQLILRLLAPPLLALLIVSIYHIPFPKLFRIIAYYSYNIYLWHFFILIPIVHYFEYSTMGLLAYLSATFFLAFVSTHLIEDFFINRRELIFRSIFSQHKVLNSNP